jgi:N-acetylglucosaminyldiphosphoundecaprenol N-acetyl-beta-D-mannosaminyltransferase
MSAERINVLGLPVDDIDMDTAVERIAGFIQSEGMHQVVTADASMVVTASMDEGFLAVAKSAAMVTSDGAGILWASRKLGLGIKNKCSGVDLAERLVSESVAREWRIFFFGAAPGVAALAASKMEKRYPGCKIVGTRDGFFEATVSATVAAQIAESNPDILLVALGIPKQEKWIAAFGNLTGAKVCIGVGGTLDVFSGTVQRAPVWMQKRGLEWFYRLTSDPRQLRNRINKQKLLPKFVGMVLRASR